MNWNKPYFVQICTNVCEEAAEAHFIHLPDKVETLSLTEILDVIVNLNFIKLKSVSLFPFAEFEVKYYRTLNRKPNFSQGTNG